MSVNAANSHDWFPRHCCGGNDCKKIMQWKEIDKDKWIIINPDGTFYLKKGELKIEPSQDNENYLCVFNGKPICLFANFQS